MWQLFGRFLSVMNFIGALMIMGLMVLISADVIGRAVFSIALFGVPELTKFGVVCILWLQMAATLRDGAHLRSTLILDVLPRIPRRIVYLLNNLTGVLLMGLIAYYAWPEIVRSYEYKLFEGEHPVRIQIWPIWGIVLLGAACTAIEYAGQAILVFFREPDVGFDGPTGIE